MYLDKLDGEIEEAFFKRHVSQWREEQDRIQEQISRGSSLLKSLKMPIDFSRIKANLNGQNLSASSFQTQN
jgi:ubiquitin C-terminal hydrolase